METPTLSSVTCYAHTSVTGPGTSIDVAVYAVLRSLAQCPVWREREREREGEVCSACIAASVLLESNTTMATPSSSSNSTTSSGNSNIAGSTSHHHHPQTQHMTTVSSMQESNTCWRCQNETGKRKALKLNFANPSVKPATRLPLNPSPSTAPSFQNPHIERMRTHSIESSGKLKISTENACDFTAEDLRDLGEIGRGAYGSVNQMQHKPSGQIMAVKRIRSTVDEKEQKQLLMDLDVVMRSSDCLYIVQFYGALFRETVKALNHLKENLKIIHRDIKPSNILMDRNGNIKLCDFGISGQLVDSIAKTRDAGCRPYMAPERIDPSASRQGYDVRSDVWSLGITLYELATGRFPYPKWNSVFDQLTQVVKGEPPQLCNSEDRQFSPKFINFVNLCLTKDESKRPKYKELLKHPFILMYEERFVDVASYVCRILDQIPASPISPMYVD
uniref:dual specificity mitogen-activated protein kinase kinase 4-like isoform X2 n=1 Tax=Oncorhynchus gorbuscha TaxID=8017 RepID=UPI001EAEEEB3|nr:dual specificity mitogen-activated protein kinase kinase 4-like isoform X2 [Oncorhynchus gorbuscha]